MYLKSCRGKRKMWTFYTQCAFVIIS